jgi:hypothetical protein
MKTPRLPLAALLLAAATFPFTACEGPDRKAMMDEVRHSVPPMAADETYFDGQVVVHLTLGPNVSGAALFGGREGTGNSKMTGFNTKAGENNFGSNNSYGSGMSSGMGGSATSPEMETNTSEESRKRAEKRYGPYQGNEGMGHIAGQTEDPESPEARKAREAQMPPALLRLSLENAGGATLVVQIRDLNSDLGNFAIRPDTVTLNPGQSVEVEPMQSLLGVDSYSIPVVISLRSGGQTQTKTLTLRPVPPPAK